MAAADKAFICDMCGKAGVRTKEHFFPKWHRKLVPIQSGGSINRAKGTKSTHDVGTFTAPVCKSCNDGWMSDLQSATKPMVSDLIVGNPHQFITPDHAKLIAQWAVMTTMALEGNDPRSQIIPIQERKAFSATQDLSPHWEVYIGKSPHPPTRGFSHRVQGAFDDNLNRTVRSQATSLLIGHLCFFTTSFYEDNAKGHSEIMGAAGLYQMHPKLNAAVNLERRTIPVDLDLRNLSDFYFQMNDTGLGLKYGAN